MNNNYKRAFGAMADKPIEMTPEEQQLEFEKQRMMPRTAIPTSAPISQPNVLNAQLQKVDMANRAQQLKELQDAEDAGAFEDANSETNQRAARLRKLVTGK